MVKDYVTTVIVCQFADQGVALVLSARPVAAGTCRSMSLVDNDEVGSVVQEHPPIPL